MKKRLPSILSVGMAVVMAIPMANAQGFKGRYGAESNAFGATANTKPSEYSGEGKRKKLPSYPIKSSSEVKKQIHKHPKGINRASESGNIIYGNMVYSPGGSPLGIYSINPGAEKMQRISEKGVVGNYAAVVIDGVYYSSAYLQDGPIEERCVIRGYDVNDFTEVSSKTVTNKELATAAAADSSGLVWGTYHSGEGGYVWGYMDYLNYNRTAVCDIDVSWHAAGITSDGIIYGVDDNGDFWKVTDKETGEMEKIGNTGITPAVMGGGCIDPKTDTFYWSAHESDYLGNLYTIDLETGKATMLFHYDDDAQMVGLFAPSIPNDNAPAAPEIEVCFPNGSLTGTVTITPPSTTCGGAPLMGLLKYT